MYQKRGEENLNLARNNLSTYAMLDRELRFYSTKAQNKLFMMCSFGNSTITKHVK